jgi:pimeloyl-ACP methyl ester carboxylesterase
MITGGSVTPLLTYDASLDLIRPSATTMSVTLAFEDVGSGPPLLILHGLFGSGMNWRRIARDLGAQRRVLSVDLRNHGASPWAGTMSYEDMAGDVAALIDRLGLERPAVLGHSMGGKVAMTLALTDPGRVERLIVADIAPVNYGDRFSSFTDAMRGVAALQATGREEIKRTLLASIPDDRTVGFLMTNLVRHGEQYD